MLNTNTLTGQFPIGQSLFLTQRLLLSSFGRKVGIMTFVIFGKTLIARIKTHIKIFEPILIRGEVLLQHGVIMCLSNKAITQKENLFIVF